MFKATLQEIEIHHQILEGDALALSKLYYLHGPEVINLLKKKFPKVVQQDSCIILDAVDQALFNYFKNPNSFDPNLSSLKRFLFIAAKRDLLNILTSEKKHNENKQKPFFDVELDEKFWNNILGTKENPENQIIHQETLAKVEKIISQHFEDPKDIEMTLMILQRIKKTEEFAKILKIEHLSKQEQKEQVKRNKDRINKVIERHNLIKQIKQVYER